MNVQYQYMVVLERDDDGGYSVWVPDLPGCASMGDTRDDALANIHEAITCHLDGLKADGLPIPQARTTAANVQIEAA